MLQDDTLKMLRIHFFLDQLIFYSFPLFQVVGMSFSMCKPEGSCRLQEVSCTLLEIPCFEAGVFLQHAGNFLWGQKWGGQKSPIWRHLRGHQKSGGICLIYLNMFVGSKIHICFFFQRFLAKHEIFQLRHLKPPAAYR